MTSGWKLWVWLECIGVFSGCVVRRYIDILTIIINFPYSTCISFFWQQHPYFFVHFFKMFFRSLILLGYYHFIISFSFKGFPT